MADAELIVWRDAASWISPTGWWVPVNAHPLEVRRRATGATRAVEPDEARMLLPVARLGERMSWPNQFVAKIQDAVHTTALTFPG